MCTSTTPILGVIANLFWLQYLFRTLEDIRYIAGIYYRCHRYTRKGVRWPNIQGIRQYTAQLRSESL